MPSSHNTTCDRRDVITGIFPPQPKKYVTHLALEKCTAPKQSRRTYLKTVTANNLFDFIRRKWPQSSEKNSFRSYTSYWVYFNYRRNFIPCCRKCPDNYKYLCELIL